jgi:hypothetical protein
MEVVPRQQTTVKGTYVSVEPYHLFRYLDEQAFRFNEREGKDADRFGKTLSTHYSCKCEPPARGYLVTSSAYEPAVKVARINAPRNAVQMAPAVIAPTSPTSA